MDFTKKKLKNGMTLLFEKRELPVASLSITNKFGAAYEPSKIKGIAHFIEHLVFTGTKTRTHEDISREIEKKGGILNAFTANDVTSFWFKLPSEHVLAGLEILSDMLNNPTFDPLKFEKEKKVVIEEIRMYHDSPQRNVFDKIVENLYESPFGEGIIGSEKTINTLTRDQVVAFFKENYSCENFIVTVVGNVEIKKIIGYLEKNFKPSKKKYVPLQLTKKYANSVEERVGIDQAHFVFATHAPKAGTQEMYALEVLNAHLAEGMSSKLFLKIREEKGLAYSVRGSISAEKTNTYHSIYVGTRKEAIPQVKSIILEEFSKIQQMTPVELEEAKQQLIGLQRVTREDSSGVMNELMNYELTSKAEDYYLREKNITKVTLQQVKKIAQISKYSTAAIVPK